MALTQDKLSILDDPQVELHLLRSCLSSCKIIHLLCTVPFSILKPFLHQFDLNLRTSLSCIMRCSLSDSSWCQASLPFSFGGLGLRESVLSASAAFLGSCNSVRGLASSLLSVGVDQLNFPDEEAAVTLFSSISGNPSILPSSQQDLQAIIDQCIFDNLYVTLSIRDQACLTALAHPSGTSSGWLKAIPKACLGLAIPGPEFVVGLCL